MTASIHADELDRLQKLNESISNVGELNEMLKETTTHHLEAKLHEEEFVRELFEEIKGVRKPPAVEEKL